MVGQLEVAELKISKEDQFSSMSKATPTSTYLAPDEEVMLPIMRSSPRQLEELVDQEAVDHL